MKTSLLPLTPDELLTTTRSVRRRLDLTRPVERELIEECLQIALQAPTPSNLQNWHFVVVTDADKRAAIAEQYRKAWAIYASLPTAAGNLMFDDPGRNALQSRIMASAHYLADHLHEVPVLLIPCLGMRVEQEPPIFQCSLYGGVIQAAWSFQLAARARGLASCWTSMHLFFEKEVAEIVGIPYDQVAQTALICVAHSKGTDFKPAPREPLATKLHWDAW
jgi:nitroreductase